MVTTDLYCLDLLLAVLLDVRFQVVFALVYFLHWNWRLPRPMKGAGNKAVLVTGCDSGMGHRMARRFDEMKMVVFAGCSSPDGPGAKALKKACSERLHVVPLDATEEEQVKEAVAYVKANIPQGEKGLYCLVNSSGTFTYGSFDLMTTNRCKEILETNVMGALRVTKYFLPLITEAKGRIVSITNGALSSAGLTLHSASKFALDGFFTSLHYELQESGVHVATVDFPGIMPWTQSHLKDMRKIFSTDIEERNSNSSLLEATKQQMSVVPPQSKETNYKLLLENVEDAILAEEPYMQYVSAPITTRLYMALVKFLPEEVAIKLSSFKCLM